MSSDPHDNASAVPPSDPALSPAEAAPADPAAAEKPTPAPASPQAKEGKLVMQIGRSSGAVPVPPKPRPTAAPPAPPPKRDAQKYAGASGEETEEEEKPTSRPEDALMPERSRGGKVSVPSKRGPLPDDLETEIAAALGELSLEDVLKQESVNNAGTPLELESRYNAPVMRIHQDNVFFSLDGRNEGVASLRQFSEPPAIGAVLEVIVSGFNNEDGLYELNIPGGAINVSDWSDIVEGAAVEAKVVAANTGGLECTINNNIRGFIPASQISMYRVEDLSQFVDQKLVCIVTEANPQRKNLVLSHRAVLEREKEESRVKTLASLEVGQTREGVVRKLLDFGAFVDIGGVDGLIHISQMSWDRIKHPSEVVSEGEKVSVRIEKIDPETGKIGLSLKNDADDPWNHVDANFPVGSTAKGVVTRIAQYGAFVKLGPGVEGLLHISELAHHRVQRVQNHVQEGQELEVKILSVDKDAQKIGLSLKATLAAPEPKEGKQPEVEVDEPRREPAIRPKRATLRGGKDDPTGGEQFGLKW
jgi:small subunit ribosomal protein S1